MLLKRFDTIKLREPARAAYTKYEFDTTDIGVVLEAGPYSFATVYWRTPFVSGDQATHELNFFKDELELVTEFIRNDAI